MVNGVGAVQLFDLWVGALLLFDYCCYVFFYLVVVFVGVVDLGVFCIYFGVDIGELFGVMVEVGVDVVGVDWWVTLDVVVCCFDVVWLGVGV